MCQVGQREQSIVGGSGPVTSAAGGLTAGAAINADLAAEDAKRAAGTTPLTSATTASH
jgi:hypothetical protein